MKKSNIKLLDNQRLIEQLIRSAISENVSKNEEAVAKTVCKELKQRNIISDPESLFRAWRG